MPRTTRTPKPAPAPYRPHVRRTTMYGVYTVESESQPGLAYTTDAILETCTCPAGQHNKPCKHVRLSILVWMAHRRLRGAARRQQQEAAGAYPVAA